MTCQGCTEGQHSLCGMQTWCECNCDGSTDWGGHEVDPDAGLEVVDDDDSVFFMEEDDYGYLP